MARQIIESPPAVPPWMAALGEPTAARLLAWGQLQAQECLTDVFGFHAVQAGWSGYDALHTNRMPHRWHAALECDADRPAPDLMFDSRAWPWPAESLDLVVLPHTLERSADPHTCLREVERVLIPEGHVFITGINPWSLWGRALRRAPQSGPQSVQPAWPVQSIAPARLRDWLHLLGFEVQLQRVAGWTPTWRTERWVQRWSWLESPGRRWCPVLAGAYAMVAVKRVPGVRLLKSRTWQRLPSRPSLTAPVTSTEAPRQGIDSRFSSGGK